jgi:hydrogenase nickel incorporation protein HypA/HybF
MHELAITDSEVAQVSERVGASRVTKVVLEIGRLSGVVPEAVRFCFDVCAQGTPLEGSALEIVDTAGLVRCRQCAREFEPADQIPLCECGSADLHLLAGSELKIKSVEVV